jgi:GT2 family glycosyltransferase/glycosyltransferase involved in cell wall biosynthesis
MLPPLLLEAPTAIIIVDNGSTDSTATWLGATHPAITVLESPAPLSFADAINLGLSHATTTHVLLLNNDMLVAPGFLPALLHPFDRVPDLFSSSAQIFFPPGLRREETGKPVMRSALPTDFPIRCDDPLPGENGTWVLYGSGGCSLYDAAKLLALGGVSPIYRPAYVEDLDLGYRAWLRGWPSVFASDAHVEHRHRATTSRYYSEAELSAMVEINYLRFLANAIASRAVFLRLWNLAIRRLHLLALERPLRAAPLIALGARREQPGRDEEEFLALTNGDVAVFPGRAPERATRILVASPYLPFPLSHGGAVRMFNLMSRAAHDVSQILISFCDELATPPDELLAICAEIVLVRRTGSHYRRSTGRPDTVEEFDSLSFHAAVRETVRKWQPALAQLEFTQMAQYARDCAPAKTLLIEHDITFDLQQQLYDNAPNHELAIQLARWRSFETEAWRNVDAVVTMSDKDRAAVAMPHAFALPNGVDTARFTPSPAAPDPRRILFIGSFAHLPNLLAIEFFLREVWPLLDDLAPELHVIAGARHEYFLDFYKKQISASRMTLEGFVADVRPAYERAAIVIAPLTASAGTNIKILEAMSMSKAIVSTPAGINGLDVEQSVMVADSPSAFAQAIRSLIEDPAARDALGATARQTALARYDWNAIAQQQRTLYNSLN